MATPSSPLRLGSEARVSSTTSFSGREWADAGAGSYATLHAAGLTAYTAWVGDRNTFTNTAHPAGGQARGDLGRAHGCSRLGAEPLAEGSLAARCPARRTAGGTG